MPRKKFTTEQFIKLAQENHGERYDYSITHYRGARSRVKIICREHGVFEQLAHNHKQGQGCRVCGGITSAQKHIKQDKIDPKTYNKIYRKQQQNRKALWLHGIKARAKKNGMEFNLVPKDITIPTHCPVFGVPLMWSAGRQNNHSNISLDRIDNTKGYTKDNVIVISFRANNMKSNATADEILQLGKFYKRLETERGEG